jgi:hypothetical protein
MDEPGMFMWSALVVAVVVTACTVLVVLVLRRSRRRVRPTVDGELKELDPVAHPGERGDHQDIELGDPADDSVSVDLTATPSVSGAPSSRVLTMHVRALEATLEEQDERLHEVARAADQLMKETLLRQRTRVDCTLLAMRDRIDDQPGAAVLNRLQAAMTRLEDTSWFERPLLAPEPSGGLAISFAVPQEALDMVPLPTVEPLPVPAADQTDPGPAETESFEALPEFSDDDTAVALHKVLPIPAPPPVVVDRRRGRRGLRRTRVS